MGNTLEYAIRLIDGFSGVADKVKSSTKGIEEGIDKLSKTASSGLGAIKGDFSKLGDIVGGLGGPVAAMSGAVVGALGAIVAKNVETADSFRRLSEKTGASVEFLSGFTQAADDVFVASETVNASLGIFSKKLGGVEDAMDGSGISANAFSKKLQEIGVNSTNVEDALLSVADRFAGMENGAAKTALAIQLFGKQGAELIPILNKGRDGIAEMMGEAKQLGLVMTTEASDGAKRLKEGLDKVNDRIEGITTRIGVGLLPKVADAVEAFDNFDKKMRVSYAFGDTSNGSLFSKITGIVRTYQTFTEVNGKFVETLSVASRQAQEFDHNLLKVADTFTYTTSKSYDADRAYQQMYGDLNHTSEGLMSQAKSAADAAKAEDAAKSSAADLAAKKQALADAVNNVNGAFSGTPAAMDKAEKAQTLFALATGTLTKQQLEQRQATEAIRDALDKGILSYGDAAGALAGLASGTLSTNAAFMLAKDSGKKYKDELTELERVLAGLPSSKTVTFTGFVTPEMTGAIDLYNSIHDKNVAVTITTNHSVGGSLDDGSDLPHRAKGGPVKKGKPYIVGEDRPEVFVPYTSGYIMPNAQTPYTAPGQRAAGASAGTFNVNNPGIIIQSANGAALAQQIARANANVARRARARAAFVG